MKRRLPGPPPPPPPPELTFSQIIEIRRQALGLSVAEVARRIGVSQPFVTYLIRGQRKPTPEHCQKLAVALQFNDSMAAQLMHAGAVQRGWAKGSHNVGKHR